LARTRWQARTRQPEYFPGFAHRLDIDFEELQLNYFDTDPHASVPFAGAPALGNRQE
jgi:hypothetical protein